MYIDKRTVNTIAALNESLVELLNDKSLRKVTVKEICEKADVNRSTYYRYFSDPQEQAMELLKSILGEARDCIISYTETIEIMEGLEDFCISFYDNKDAYLALRENISTDDYAQMVEDMFRWRTLPFLGIMNGELGAAEEDYVFDYAMNAAQTVIVKWLKDDADKVTAKTIASFLYKSVFNILTPAPNAA